MMSMKMLTKCKFILKHSIALSFTTFSSSMLFKKPMTFFKWRNNAFTSTRSSLQRKQIGIFILSWLMSPEMLIANRFYLGQQNTAWPSFRHNRFQRLVCHEHQTIFRDFFICRITKQRWKYYHTKFIKLQMFKCLHTQTQLLFRHIK